MDDLSSLISQIMSNPESMQQLQQVAASMGLSNSGDNSPASSAQGQQSQPVSSGRNANRGQQARNQSGQRQQAQSNTPSSPQPQPPPALPPPTQSNAPSVDLDSLSQLLGRLTGKPAAQPPPANDGVDLSALSSLLGGASQQPATQPSSPSSGDLSDMLSGLLGGGGNQQNQQSTPDISAMLSGLMGGSDQQQTNSPDLSALSGLLGNTNSQQNTGGGGMDLSALSGLLGNSGGQNGGADLSGLSSLLGGLGANPAPEPSQNSSVAALANMLGGGQGSGAAASPLGGLNINTILKLQQAMSSINANQDNIRLLLGLKSRLQTDRAKKVDDAIRVMQLIQFLPLLKETGIFGSIDSLLGGLGGSSGGVLSGLLGGGSGSGSGLGGLLSGLNPFGGR